MESPFSFAKMCELDKMKSRRGKGQFMILHNDIWGDTSVIIIEKMDNKKWHIAEGKMVLYIAPTKRKSRPSLSDESAKRRQ